MRQRGVGLPAGQPGLLKVAGVVRAGGAQPRVQPRVQRLAAKLRVQGRDQESAAWRLVVAPAELEAVAQLQPCQQLAIRHIRALAQDNHERALPYLQRRALGLGFSDGDLQMALLWVRDLADIICHVKLEKVGPAILHDTHYRNQFETNTSSGFLKHEARIRWERVLFGPAYDGVEGLDRPKYGVQNILNDYRGPLQP
ncbi:unnamed protein product [Prorocentrum cordatum]|uniref:Selenoprotein O n=1 Tax=Prorocentrum cordatum TaxID=2364126 RepID=A0ABN9R3F6_9DINO|nr:unnamed protein product [Polarella glacialis]